MPEFIFRSLLMTLADPAYWCQCISAAIFTYSLLGRQKHSDRRPIGVALRMLFLVGVFVAIHVGLSLLSFKFRILAGTGTWFSYLFGVILFAIIFCKYDTRAKVVTAAAALSIIITLFELGAVYGRLLEHQIQGFNSLYTKIAACVMLLLAGMVLGKYQLHRFYVSTHAAYLNLVTCAASSLSVMVYDGFTVHVFPMGGNGSIAALMSVLLLALFIIITACYFMTYHLSREYTMVLDLTAETQMNKSASALMAVTEEKLSEFHKIQHDIDNQYAYIRAMMDSGDYDGLRHYVDELTSTFAEPVVPLVDCGNHVMNLIFNMEVTKARKLGVGFDIKAVTPHELPFSQLDLVKLYTNLMDNAMEACVAEKIDAPSVAVNVSVVGEYLFTRISNPTFKKKSFLDSGMPTSKEDARSHGKGMSIVRSIIKKYDGSLRYAISDGAFVVEFMLCLKEAPRD